MIYLDNAATYIDSRLRDNVLKCFFNIVKKYPGNPSSSHYLGYLANKKINNIRQEIINILELDGSYEIIFNSGATEGINHAIKGYALKNKKRGNEIIVFVNEHPSVLATVEDLKKYGFNIIYVGCLTNGELDYDDLQKKINNNTILVAVMHVNNETGAINNVQKIADIVHKYSKCVFFCDTTQSIGKIDINYNLIDMFVCSSHKIGGIIGSGFLIKKKKILLEKLINGGEQENNYRSGTTSVALASTTLYVLKEAQKKLEINSRKVNFLKNILLNELLRFKEIKINSYHDFPYIINFSLKNKKASVVIEALSKKKIYVSSLSACSSKINKISYVLTNMKKNKQEAENSIRVSFSCENSKREIIKFVKELGNILKNIL